MYSRAYAEIGEIIRDARLKKGITQKDVSDLLGFTCTQYISNLERGVTTMSADKLGKICAFLEIPNKKIQKLLVDAYAEKLEIGFKEGKEEISQEQFKKTA